MSECFPLRRCWASRFLWPLVRTPVVAEVADGTVTLRMGGLGGAVIATADIARVSRMNWPWWGGIGARLGRGLVAFTTAWGEAAVIEMVDTVEVRAPMRWRTRRVIVGVEDVSGFLRAIARTRGVPVDSG